MFNLFNTVYHINYISSQQLLKSILSLFFKIYSLMFYTHICENVILHTASAFCISYSC